jgi:hypothetical protein
MATDATGTPTDLGIPTYNPNVDAPSGLGFNEAMEAIDALIAGRIEAPSSPAEGDVPVWDSATGAWVKSSSGQLVATGALGTGTADATKFLRGDQTWAVPALYLRKTTTKTVTNSTTITDLLNGEITVPAGALTSTGFLRFTAWGTYLQNSGSTQALLRFGLALGSTSLVDTNTVAAIHTSNTAAHPWKFQAVIKAQNATNAQFVLAELDLLITGGNTATTLAGGTGLYWAPAAIGGYSQTRMIGQNTSAEDMASAKNIALNVVQPVASASVTTVLQGALVEVF